MNIRPLRALLTSTAMLVLAALPAQAQRRAHGLGDALAARYGHAAPAVRAVHGRPGPSLYGYEHGQYGRHWVPGRYETVSVRVWIPERVEHVWVEPVFGLRTDVFGVHVRVELSPGHYERVVQPGHFTTRRERRWVPGHWILR